MKRSGRSWFWLQGAAAGGVIVAAPGTALVTAILLCPAVAFYAFEATVGRPVGRTMLLCGSTAAFEPLRALWSAGGGAGGALNVLADPARPLFAWVACGSGWLLCEAIQVAIRMTLTARSRQSVERLRQEEVELMEEWSLPPAPSEQPKQ